MDKSNPIEDVPIEQEGQAELVKNEADSARKDTEAGSAKIESTRRSSSSSFSSFAKIASSIFSSPGDSNKEDEPMVIW